MITVEEFKLKYLPEGEIENLVGADCVYTSGDIVEHKMVYNTEVWKVDDQFFEVMYSRSNSGYWGDSESYDPEVYEVFPYTFTETRYK